MSAMSTMNEFKDKIPTGTGKLEYLWNPNGVGIRISGTFRGLYQVAMSMDGQQLLSIVPVAGMGQIAVYPRPSVLAFIQSDEQGMWGRNCPACQKYFRTTHVPDITFCPYCSAADSSLAFISKDQRNYLTACYDTFARAYNLKTNTSLDFTEITDQTPAWHYSEEKQQFHFKCAADGCDAETDILGEYGYCPRCGRSNARKIFSEVVDKELARLEEVKTTVSDRYERGIVWENLTVEALSKFEALAKHLRRKLLLHPMTANRRHQLEKLSFQKPLAADESLRQWFDIGLMAWAGNTTNPARQIAASEMPFMKLMIQRRHILIHNGGLVDQEYLELSGDSKARLDERIRIRSNEAKRFVTNVGEMGMNLLDNIEGGFD